MTWSTGSVPGSSNSFGSGSGGVSGGVSSAVIGSGTVCPVAVGDRHPGELQGAEGAGLAPRLDEGDRVLRAGVQPPVVADHGRDAGVVGHVREFGPRGDRPGERLLGEHRQTRLEDVRDDPAVQRVAPDRDDAVGLRLPEQGLVVGVRLGTPRRIATVSARRRRGFAKPTTVQSSTIV